MSRVRSWEHSGFHVFVGEPIQPRDKDARLFVARYLKKCPLFYVAVTRAMNRLWLSFLACRTHGRTLRDTMPSQYLYESGAHLFSSMSGADISPAQGDLFG